MKEILIFAGSAGNPLADKIHTELYLRSNLTFKDISSTLGEVELDRFPSGESYCQFKDNLRGRDVFIVQSISNPANERFMELLVMLDAAKRASAGRITAVIPFMGYLRQDRKTKSRTPITAKLAADLLTTAGASRILSMDFHCPQAQGFFNVPVDHLYALPLFAKLTETYNPEDIIIIAPDVGGVKRASALARLMKCEMAFIAKRRLSATQVEADGLVGNVEGKNAIIIDDMTESVGTLLQAAETCKKNGAKQVIAAVTHGLLTPIGEQRLASDRSISKLYITNTVTQNSNGLPIEVIDVAPIFAKAIECIHQEESVSELFEIQGI